MVNYKKLYAYLVGQIDAALQIMDTENLLRYDEVRHLLHSALLAAGRRPTEQRLETGSFQWPGNGKEAQELTAQQYRWLMEGLRVEQLKAHRSITGLSMI